MKKKLLTMSVVLICLVMLPACSKGEGKADTGGMSKKELDQMVEDTKSDLLPVITIEDYEKKVADYDGTQFSVADATRWEMEELDGKEIGVEKPAGILCRKDDILILDQESSAIKVLDYDKKCINSVGKLGNGELEFHKPTGFAAQGDIVYVMDAENHRIQKLTRELEHVADIKNIEVNAAEKTQYSSIATDPEGNMYMAGDLMMSRTIVEQDKDGTELHHIIDNFYGSVYSNDTGAYAINVGQVSVNPAEKGMGFGFGKNVLLSLSGQEATFLCELPESLRVLSFCIKDDTIYCVSFTEKAVMAFDMEGNYLETIGELPDPDNNEQDYYIDVDDSGNVYVTNTGKGKVYLYKRL